MNIGIGGIVSLGGGSSSSSGGGSGIQSLNSQIGPAISIVGVNGAQVTSGGNLITINLASLSGLIGSNTQSGVVGVNGIVVSQVGGNFVIDGASLSGQTGTISGVSVNAVLSYSAEFSNLTSGIFDHGFGTRETIVQIYDDSLPPRVIVPDAIISENLNQIGIIFNAPQTGRIVIHAPSGGTIASSNTTVSIIGVSGIRVIPSGVNTFVISGENISMSGAGKFSQSFTGVSSVNIPHNLGSEDVIVQVRDSNSPAGVIFPDSIVIVDANIVSVYFNTIRSGRVTVMG